jgi:DNA-directed RNA polymerase specialized sigma24 family protein
MLSKVGKQESSECTDIVNSLIILYWKAVFCYIRCCGYREEAVELTEDFFVHCFLRDVWGRADRQRGRFRNLLITSLNNFLASEYKRRKIEHARFVSLDDLSSKGQADNFIVGADAEYEFNQAWKRELIIRVWENLQEEFQNSDKTLHLELFRLQLYAPLIEETDALSLSELAEKFSIPVKKASNMITTVKRAFKRLLREEISLWAGSPQEINEEINGLIRFFPDGF